MAGARPSSFKKGGGFLNEVDGVIADLRFTTEPPFERTPRKGRANGEPEFHGLYCVLTARVDGADEDVQTTLFVGSADDFDIAQDGAVLVPVDDSVALRQNSDFGIFLASLVAAGFPEELLPEDEITYAPVLGTRVRFAQRVNVEKTKRLGRRKGKGGKGEYDRTDLVIDKVYALPGQGVAAGKKAAVKAAGKPVKATTTTTKAKSAPVEDDLSDVAGATLLTILNEAGGELPKAKLSVRMLRALSAHPQRQAVYNLGYSDDFLSREDMGWAYDATSQMVSLSE